MSIREVYEKYCHGDPISDEELSFGIKNFTRLESDLSKLGPEFRFSCNEVRRVLYSLEQFRSARLEK